MINANQHSETFWQYYLINGRLPATVLYIMSNTTGDLQSTVSTVLGAQFSFPLHWLIAVVILIIYRLLTTLLLPKFYNVPDPLFLQIGCIKKITRLKIVPYASKDNSQPYYLLKIDILLNSFIKKWSLPYLKSTDKAKLTEN